MERENARKNTSDIRNVTPKLGLNNVCHNFGRSMSLPFFTSTRCVFVSVKYSAVNITAMIVIISAMTKGTEVPNPTVKAATAGPNPNQKLNAAHIVPNAPGRSSGVVESEMTENATGILPAVISSRARARKRKSDEGAKDMTKNDTAVPMIGSRSMGLRPYLSDNRSMTSVEINWQIENEANNSPFWKSDKPNFLEYA